MQKISAVYKITNTITGDFYIGSSKNIKHRWAEHKCKSSWNKQPNNPLYQDFQKYGIDKFEFQILAEVEESFLKEKEQYFIETLKPTYNDRNANGLNVERQKKSQKEYQKSDKRKESHRKSNKKYDNQLCFYNGQTITLNALRKRFRRRGIVHPTVEAKKYLIKSQNVCPGL